MSLFPVSDLSMCSTVSSPEILKEGFLIDGRTKDKNFFILSKTKVSTIFSSLRLLTGYSNSSQSNLSFSWSRS